MFIPGIVITIVTFPGVIVHELAHQLFCRWLKIPVFNVCYFQFDNPAGYVIHEIPKNTYHQILVGIGPFIVNTLLGAVIAMPASLAFFKFGNPQAMDYILIYLGVSIAMHSFPSTGDAASITEAINGSKNILVKIVGYPIVGIIYLGALGSVLWLDLIYGIGVAVLLPELIILIFS
ncbi:MAG: hypothetical protein ACK40G_12180 [Cytophagaceae bacterium]